MGPVVRLNNPDGWHPMVRNDWQTADPLRGVLGTYRVIYTGSAGAQSWNYAAALRGLHAESTYGIPGATEQEGGSLTTAGQPRQLVKQLNNPAYNKNTNIVIDYSFSVDPAGDKWIHLTPAGNNISDPLTNAWRNYYPYFWEHNDGKNWLAENFGAFLSTSSYTIPYGGQTTYTGLLYNLLPHIGNDSVGQYAEPAQVLFDHASNVSIVSSDINIRKVAGYNVNIDPVYNFYPSTTPPYEDVIADIQIPEHCLPNIYYLQSELNNPTPILNAVYHLGALTLSTIPNAQGVIPWFNVANQQNVTEANVDSYYDLYAEGLADLRSAFGHTDLPDNFPGVKDNLEKNNKNFVVLHSDLDAIKEDRIQRSVVPFYNRIELGNDPENRTGLNSSVSILKELYDNVATRDIVNMLQMEAVLTLTNQGNYTTQYTNFMESHKGVNSDTDATDFSMTSETTSRQVLYEVGDLLDDYSVNFGAHLAAGVINYMGNLSNIPFLSSVDLKGMPFRLIRDYKLSADQLACDPACVPAAMAELQNSGSAGLTRVTRDFGQILSGSNAHTETLLYIVKKKDSNAAGAQPIQTFYISPEFRIDTPTVYIDTQVKYGKTYYYEIDRVVLVFGNKYTYQSVEPGTQSYDPTWYGGAKIKYTNEPSVQALVLPYTNGAISTIIDDRPPVPPEVNFYPYKGINNKLKILLNSSTGKFSARPVSILANDEQRFLDEYHSQTGDVSISSYEELKSSGVKIDFRSDDPVDAYELFRLDTIPESYQSFAGTEISIDPDRGIPGSYEDTIIPNTKYYYCARSIDIHGNLSNPTHIYEIEIVDNNGQIFVKQRVFNYEAPQEDFVKEGRRFIYIEPSLAQTALQLPPGITLSDYSPAPSLPPPTSILGSISLEDSVWTKKFKVRLTSTKTGRKVDLNLTFKNSGIVNASE